MKSNSSKIIVGLIAIIFTVFLQHGDEAKLNELDRLDEQIHQSGVQDNFEGHRLLLAEDVEINRKLSRHCLNPHG